MPLIFGEVLFDCFSDSRNILGGAPFNIAWNLQAFGASPVLVSRVGDDDLGMDIRDKMEVWDMTAQFLQTDPTHPTGKVRIELHGGEPHFTILPDQAYDFIEPPAEDLEQAPRILYHGSLALRNDASRRTLAHLKNTYRCPVFIDVNLRPPWWEKADVHTLVADATWLKLNEAELNMLFPEKDDMEERCRSLLERFELETIFITLGEKGAAACDRSNKFITVRPGKNIPVVDTVGAGDAFSSVLILGLMHDWPLRETMQRAQEFAGAVVGRRGATTMDKHFYNTISNSWDVR